MVVISLLLACGVSVAAQELSQQMPHELIAEEFERMELPHELYEETPEPGQKITFPHDEAFAHELYEEDLAPSHRRKLAKADQDVVQWIATGKWKVSNNGRTANLPAVGGGHGMIYANQPKSSNKCACGFGPQCEPQSEPQP